MSLDPAEERWLSDKIGVVEKDAAELYGAARDAATKLVALNMRLRVLENREKSWKGLCLALGLALFGSIGGTVYWAGGLAADVRHVAETSAALKELAREFHEHERRASTPKAEPAR